MPRSNSSLRRHPPKPRHIDKLTQTMLAGLPKVAARTMAQAAAAIARLQRMAEDTATSDIHFLQAARQAAKNFPALFKELDIRALEKFIFDHQAEAYRAGHVDKRKQFEEAKTP